jgi:transcriptional regulator NrdR family protein
MDHPHIVKRRGHQEAYDNHKVYGSCYAACLNTHLGKDVAETHCTKVTKEVDAWIEGKATVSSQEIFEEVARAMEKYHKNASFMYKTHRDIS